MNSASNYPGSQDLVCLSTIESFKFLHQINAYYPVSLVGDLKGTLSNLTDAYGKYLNPLKTALWRTRCEELSADCLSDGELLYVCLETGGDSIMYELFAFN